MAEGVIKRLVSERGFGFIKPTEGKDLFFHSHQVRGATFQDLKEGLPVEFQIGSGPKGPMAVNIRPLTYGIKKASEDGNKELGALAGGKDNTRARRRAFRDRDRKEPGEWD